MQNASLLWKMTGAIDKFSSAERSGACTTSGLWSSAWQASLTFVVDMVKSTIRSFEDRALPVLTKHCQAGIIHCDPNDQNILANDAGSTAVALIDYGDVCMSYYVCNIAIGKRRPEL